MEYKKTEEEQLEELIDMDGSYINGDYRPSDSLTTVNEPDRNGVVPPTSATFARQTGQDPSARLHFLGLSAVLEGNMQEDIVQKPSEESLLDKNVNILTLKDLKEVYSEQYLANEVEKMIKDINELWSKYSEREKDFNIVKTSLIYAILKNTNAKDLPKQYADLLKKAI